MKLLVNVYIPAISQKYDVLIPDSLRIKHVVSMIAEAVDGMSNHLYVSSGSECLCSVEKNILLRQNMTLASYGIQNGDHLVMM